MSNLESELRAEINSDIEQRIGVLLRQKMGIEHGLKALAADKKGWKDTILDAGMQVFAIEQNEASMHRALNETQAMIDQLQHRVGGQP
jgi:hypothetical protein